jgi:hypothetical protein
MTKEGREVATPPPPSLRVCVSKRGNPFLCHAERSEASVFSWAFFPSFAYSLSWCYFLFRKKVKQRNSRLKCNCPSDTLRLPCFNFSPIRKRIKAQNYVENQLCKKAKQFAFFTSFLELRNSLSRSNAPLRLYPTSRFNAWALSAGKETANKFAVFQIKLSCKVKPF